MHIGKDLREVKLKQLLKAEGYASIEELYPVVLGDVVSPAICIEPHCQYTCEMEPDQTEGYCEACGGNTVVSALVLAGLI
jgi:hypothetical protein